MKKAVFLEIICFVLILLFLYAALSKLFLFNIYVKDLHRQKLIAEFAPVLSIVIPAVELIIAGLLFFPRRRLFGLYSYLALMIVFTMYVAYAIYVADDTPCSCGGLIRDLTWREHFLFNLFFIILTLIAIWLEMKKNSTSGGEITANVKLS